MVVMLVNYIAKLQQQQQQQQNIYIYSLFVYRHIHKGYYKV